MTSRATSQSGKAHMKAASQLSLVCLFAFVLSGCSSVSRLEREVAEHSKEKDLQEMPGEPLPEAEISSLTGRHNDDIPLAEMLDESPLNVDSIMPENEAALKDKFVLPSRPDLSIPTRQVSEYPRDLITGMIDPSQKVPVDFVNDATQLGLIVPQFAHLLNFNYIIDPDLMEKGAVTGAIVAEMTGEEVWDLFEHVLWLSGAYASPNPGFIHVLPFSKMTTERRLMTKHKPQPNVQVQLIPMFNTKSAEMAGMLQPYLTPGATATNVPRLNSLLLVDAPMNMPKLLELVEILDSPGEAAWPHITIRCTEVDAETIKAELETLMPILGFAVSNQTPSGGELKLTALPRLQVIVASAALKDVLKEVETWVRMLDRADASAKEDIFFYNVRHGTAEQLSGMLQVFFNSSATTSTTTSQTKATSTRAAASDTERQAAGNRPATGATTPRPTPGTPRKIEEPQSDSVFETPVVIYVDDVQNRLTIRTTQRAYAAVKALLERQDVPVRQVMIEAIIAEITLGRNTEFGFAYAAKHGSYWYGYNGTGTKISTLLPKLGDNAGDPTIPADDDDDSDGADPDATIAQDLADNFYNFVVDGSVLGGPGISALNLKDDALAFVKAVAGEANTKVISAPQIMAATGEEARIEVGKEVAIKTTQYYGENDDRANYEYRNTGTILTVTPYITAGNMVRVQIEQEVSSVIESTRAELDSPDISKKNLSTTLTIPDGSTIMMGGLIDTVRSESSSGVPFLKDIPYLGVLFRSNSKTSGRQELLVLITVHVVDPSSRNATESLARRFQAALDEIKHQFEK